MHQAIKNYYHLLQAAVANFIFGFPSGKLKVIGVTGTDGKTTTTNLIYHILITSGFNTSMISTIGAAIGGKTYDVGFHVTTPSPFAIQNYIKKAVDSGSKYLVLETTSHALDQYRVWGIRFEIGVLTNVTHEHLDYHKTHDRYLDAKMRLLTNSKVAIINRDDESYDRISSKLKFKGLKLQLKVQKLLTYGLSINTDVNPKHFPFQTKLFGRFNKYNCLAAIAACKSLGLKNEEINKSIFSFKPPIGRQDIVYNKDFKVMIDFAHTPHAFEVLLPEIRSETKGHLIHVFGSAGERDITKRPKMGEVSSKYSDIIILTAEDPRKESVEKINTEIERGIIKVKAKPSVHKISNRKEAIQYAISLAQKGDFVVITGKSHEKSMNYGHGEKDWDEYKAVVDSLKKKNAQKR